MSGLLAFQQAAVDRIVARLRDPVGTRRFLLADEVGLGKTLIAREVLKALADAHVGNFTAVYVCSNQEIAHQNRTKLAPDGSDSGEARRLTMLCLDLFGAKPGRPIALHCFTPGTSLSLGGATGRQDERRLILYLLDRMGETPVGRRLQSWAEFFRCSCGEERWWSHVKRVALQDEFNPAGITDAFVEQTRATWAGLRPPPGSPLAATLEGMGLLEVLPRAVDAFRDDAAACWAARNAIIGGLRTGLAFSTVRQLESGVLILDEFQKFDGVLAEAGDPNSIVGQLINGTGAGRVPVLILSATPYKMHSLPHEDEHGKHYGQFLKTLAFLYREPADADRIKALRRQFTTFGQLLRAPEAWEREPGAGLVAARGDIQTTLTEVASRTERNWYLEDVAKGVEEVRDGCESDRIAQLPTVEELRDFLGLRQFLLAQKLDDWKILDFWKSCPAPLLFMDGGYSLIKRIRGSQAKRGKKASWVRVDAKLVPTIRSPKDLAKLESKNARFRLLKPRVFGDPSHGPRRVCRFLWTRPTYLYHTDTFYRDEEPSKFLLFSHWRMVPKAVSALVSQAAVARLPGKGGGSKQPLNFRSPSALFALWPSPGLAALIDPLALGVGNKDRVSAEELQAAAVAALRSYIGGCPKLGIKLGKPATSRPRVLEAMLRLDAHWEGAAALRPAITKIQKQDLSGELHGRLDEIVALLDATDPITLSPDDLRDLARVALCSPATSALRASWTVFDDRPSTVEPCLTFALNSLRSFFNSEAARRIVLDHGTPGRGSRSRAMSNFAGTVLLYCRDAHFQAAIDEYVWLVRETAQRKQPGGSEGLFPHLERGMGMWTGRPQLNRVDAKGKHVPGPRMVAQYALAFGEDVYRGEEGDNRGAQRSAVRDAFNSPFWPFVLATTSVGQEGLDFHLYCRDIVHWNLPANPVDLEQREGRINRYNGLFVRRNIAEDYPIRSAVPQLSALQNRIRGGNLWDAVFRTVHASPRGLQRFKHGLHPNWIYRPESRNGAPGSRPLIRRHLLFYTMSEDERDYARLKRMLTTYRLAFGQPRQQDLLDDLLASNPELESSLIERRMRRYMVNLSPMTPEKIDEWVKHHVRLMLGNDGVAAFVEELRRDVIAVNREALGGLADHAEWLIAVAVNPATPPEGRADALFALVYLANPFDKTFDFLEGVGFDDDATVLEEARQRLRPGT